MTRQEEKQQLRAIVRRLEAALAPEYKEKSARSIAHRLLAMLAAPATWCTVVSWLVAVVAESACNSRGSKPLAAFGVVLAAALLVAGAFAAAWFETGMVGVVAPGPGLIVPIAVSAAIMLFVVVVLRK